MTRPTILLTGATGSVGRVLRPLLSSEFDLRLTGLEDAPELGEGENYIASDLGKSTDVDRVLDGVDGVIHLAGLVTPAASFQETLAPNYFAVLNLLEAMTRRGISRLVYASSHHAIGMLPSDRSWGVDAPIAPDSYYGLSKAFGEAACAMFSLRYGIQTLVVRIGNADAKVSDARRARMWTSARDLASLVSIGLRAENLGYKVVNAASQCPDPLLSISSAEELGYVPLDASPDFLSQHYVPSELLSEADGKSFVGGFFAMRDLPPASR